jgi:hypothetical protein
VPGVVLVAVSGLRVTLIDRTAYPAFARVVSARELAEPFTPTEAEIDWARGRTSRMNVICSPWRCG